jgi:NH3-dependent NAD+ synthetase
MPLETNPQTETPDLLIEQSMRLFEVYSARQSSAETKIAGAVTAAVALGAITVNATTTTTVEKVFGGAVLLCVTLSVIVALLARSWSGLRRTGRFSLSSESGEFRKARSALSESEIDESPARVKDLTLEMWRARERDTHLMARAKEQGAAVAGILLGLALICYMTFGCLLLTTG